MNNVERAAFVINETYADEYVKIHMTPLKVAQALADAGLLAPEPQIIRTPAELEALDGDTVLNDSSGAVDTAEGMKWAIGRGWIAPDFPAVMITPGAQVRAARTALQEATITHHQNGTKP